MPTYSFKNNNTGEEFEICKFENNEYIRQYLVAKN